MPTNWDEFEPVASDWSEFEPVDEGREQRKAELAQEKEQLQREAKATGAAEALFTGAERALEPLTAPGLLNQPARIARALGVEVGPDPFQPGQTLTPIPKPTGTGVMAGLGRLGAGVVEGLTTPEMLVTLPAAGASGVVRALFAGEMAKNIPAQIGQAGDVLRSPEATVADKIEAAGQPLVASAFVRALAKTPEAFLPVERPPTPPVPGDTLRMPEGAKPPPPKTEAALEAKPAEAQVDKRGAVGDSAGVQPAEQADTSGVRFVGKPYSDWPYATVTASTKGEGYQLTTFGEFEGKIYPSADESFKTKAEAVARAEELGYKLKEPEKGVENATKAGSEQGGIPAERAGDDTSGAPAEAGGSSGIRTGAGIQEKAPEVLLETPSDKKAEALDYGNDKALGWGTPLNKDSSGRFTDIRKQLSSGEYIIGAHYVKEGQYNQMEFGRVVKVLKGAVDIERPDGTVVRLTEQLAKYTKVEDKVKAKRLFEVARGQKSGSPVRAEEAPISAQQPTPPAEAGGGGGVRTTPPIQEKAPEVLLEPKPKKRSTKDVAKAWSELTKDEEAKNDTQNLLSNWDDAELNQDASGIVLYPGRDSRYSKGKEGGKFRPSKSSFLDWLASDEPFNPKEFVQDAEWVATVNRSRKRAGIPEKQAQPAAPPAEQAKAVEAKAQEPAQPTGMGGAVPSEYTPPAKVTTAAKNAAIDRDRIERGQPPMMEAMRKADADLWAQAMNAIDADWQAADKLIAQLKTNPRVLLDWEHMVLLQRRVDLKNEWYKATREIEQATAEGRTEAADAARITRDQMAERLLELDQVVGRGDTAAGTLAGRALRARRLVMNEDFSLGELVAQRSEILGRKLTEPEIAETKRLADEWKARSEELEKALVDAEARATASKEAEILAKAQRDARADGISDKVLEIAREMVDRWDREAEEASKRLMAKFARTSAGVDPTILLDVAKVGRSYLGHKALDFAEWSVKLTEKFGEAVKPYLKPAWDRAQQLIGSELKPKSENVKRAVKLKQTDVNAIGQRIAEKLHSGTGKRDFSWQLQQLARYFVTQGENTAAGLLDKVYGVVQQFAPELSKSEVRDMLSGYGRFTQISKEATAVVLRDLKGQLQQIGKLEDMAGGKAPRKSGYERRTPSDEERRLIKQVEEKKKEGGYTVTDPETQLRTALQAAKTRIENQIKDLEFQIAKREKIVKEKRVLKADAELETLRARRDSLKEEFDKVFPERPMTEAERLQAWKEHTLDKIEEYRDRIKRGDFKPKPKPDPVRLDPEAIKIQYELHKVHRAWMDLRLKDKLAQRNTVRKVVDAAINAVMISRALMTGGEFSAVLRQGGIGAMSHPIRTGKAMLKMFRSFRSEEAQFKIMEELQTRENAPLYKKSHLEFTEMGTRLSNMEEHYMFRVNERLRKVPGFKQLFGSLEAFQRAFTTFLNVMRADTFDAMIREYGVGAADAAANYINVTSGRGSHSLGRFIGPGANVALFAPRLAISRWQYLLGQPIVNAKGYRSMVLKEYARTLAGLSAVYAIGTLAGGEVEKDMRSSDGGKIKFGNMRIDPLFGLAPVIRLISQLVTGTRKTKNDDIRPVRDKWRMPFAENQITGKDTVQYGEPNWADLAGRHVRGKLAPVPSTMVDIASGKDVVGQEVTLPGEVVKLLTPITYSDIYQAFKQEGIERGAAATILSVFGMGVQTYDEDAKRR